MVRMEMGSHTLTLKVVQLHTENLYASVCDEWILTAGNKCRVIIDLSVSALCL